MVKGNLVLPSGAGLGRRVGSSRVTQPAHAAACHPAPAIFAEQVNQSLHRKTLALAAFPFFFFCPPFFFSPSPPWSYTPLCAPSLPGTGALQASDASAVQSGCGQPGRQPGGPWATCPCKPRASAQSQPGAEEMTRAKHSHKAAGGFFLNNFFISGRRKS